MFIHMVKHIHEMADVTDVTNWKCDDTLRFISMPCGHEENGENRETIPHQAWDEMEHDILSRCNS